MNTKEAMQDILLGFGNEPPQMSKFAKVRPKSQVFHHKELKTMKAWKLKEGEGDHCIICDTTQEVSRSKFQFMQPLCKSCRKAFTKGEISPKEFLDAIPRRRPQPMPTQKTVGRVRAIKGSLVKELGNARWIACQCGRRFKTFPFKPYSTHPPAFDKWISHATGDIGGHMPVDWSDRNPHGESAILSRWHDIAIGAVDVNKKPVDK